MEKEKESDTSYKGLSPNEYHLLSLIEMSSMVVFNVRDVMQILTFIGKKITGS